MRTVGLVNTSTAYCPHSKPQADGTTSIWIMASHHGRGKSHSQSPASSRTSAWKSNEADSHSMCIGQINLIWPSLGCYRVGKDHPSLYSASGNENRKPAIFPMNLTNSVPLYPVTHKLKNEPFRDFLMLSNCWDSMLPLHGAQIPSLVGETMVLYVMA